MRLLIQRVSEACVCINGIQKAAIGKGLLIFVGFEEADQRDDLEWGARKIHLLRIFDDSEGVMNRSLSEVEGEVLLISQFTLHAQTKKGNRPSYIKAAPPEKAIPLYEAFISCLETTIGKKIGTGTFGADMKVSLTNDGPVSIWIDTKNKE